MKLNFLKEDSLETLRGNIKSNFKKYSQPTNEWIYEFFQNQEPFGEYKYEVNKFELLISEDKPEETDIENIKILYSNLKMITDSQATDERLWAGIAHSNFWEYMHNRWKLSEGKLNEKEVKSKFFFTNGRIRSLIVHPIAKLWWAGRNTYDERRENPFELTEFLKRDFSTRNFYLFSSNFSKNKGIVRALISAMVDIEKEGTTISRSVFLTTIINSSKGVPALFDETKDSKRIEFATDTGDFNVYVKYSTAIRDAKVNINGRRRKKMSCNVSFSDRDYEILQKDFYKEDKQNLICLVCTNDKLNETYMAVLDYEDAVKCLEQSTNSGSRRITVTRIGAEYDFYCYGVGFSEEEYIKCPVDCTKFLGLKEAL